jgi:hypothetical protein
MTNESIIKSCLAIFCWREASAYGGDTVMTAVAFAMRNRTLAGWGDYLQLITNHPKISYRTDNPLKDAYPDLREPSFQRFLMKLDVIYSNSLPDTLTYMKPGKPGLYWADLSCVTNELVLERIIRNPTEHPKTASVSPLCFYA